MLASATSVPSSWVGVRGRAAELGEREEVALVGVEVELAAQLVLLGLLDLLGDEPQLARLEPPHLGGQLVRRELADVELDDRRELEQRLHLRRVLERVEREREPGVDRLVEHGRSARCR